MNGKLIKEIRKLIKEEIPGVLAQESNAAAHRKLAEEMHTIIKEIVPTLLASTQQADIHEKIKKDVMLNMQQIEEYNKQALAALAKKLEDAIEPFLKSKQA